MPEPPDVSITTRYVLENPWPLGLALLVIGIGVGIYGLREGRMDRVRLALLPAVLGLLVLILGWAVTTAGEHGEAVTRAFVEAAVAEDLVAVDALLADEARLHFGSPTNLAYDRDFVMNRLSWFTQRYDIEENTISHLHGYSEGSDTATVHLACWTEVTTGVGATPSQWVVGVHRQADESWKIVDLTCVSIASRAATDRMVGR